MCLCSVLSISVRHPQRIITLKQTYTSIDRHVFLQGQQFVKLMYTSPTLTWEKSHVQTLASSSPAPRSISTSRSSSLRIEAARSSSINDSGSPLVNSLKGEVLGLVGDGMKETDTDVGEMVEGGREV